MAVVYLFDTQKEYLDEIEIVRSSLRRSMAIGAENENNSGGSTRKMKEIEFNNLLAYFERLRREIKGQFGCPQDPFMITPGW